jgi:hypothetical protein
MQPGLEGLREGPKPLGPNGPRDLRRDRGNAASAVQQFRDDHSICERIPLKH